MKKSSFELKLPVNYSYADIEKSLKKNGIFKKGVINITRQSLDARKKSNIHWNVNIEISKEKIDFTKKQSEIFNISRQNREKRVIIVGSGPAGIFSGLILLNAGFKVTILEQGKKVEDRDKDIISLMNNGIFNPNSNFAFGEGGAGTYSDGKLTSRNKHISKEKDFILTTFINSGAPEEIYSLVHPHIGSDNLKTVTKNLRESFLELGGEFCFETKFISFSSDSKTIKSVETSCGVVDLDYLILATGHSSFSTYRELIKKGVHFTTKNFALGFRAEHPQELINEAQWGVSNINGLKAAEYRLTAKTDSASVFSFCMCPGGVVVPAAATKDTSIVNGMSNYNRDGKYANAAVVASFNFSEFFQREVSPLEALDKLEELEHSYYQATGGYSIPGMKISDFINGRPTGVIGETSYPLGITPYNLEELLPKTVIKPLKQGLIDFSKKLSGYETGTIMGLESKTSSTIQVSRDSKGLCDGFNNLYFAGEGAGWAGGIVSSAADGIKSALDIITREG